MKRVDLEKALRKAGCELVRHGSNHDWWLNPATGVHQPVPRHREIREQTARQILRLMSAEAD